MSILLLSIPIHSKYSSLHSVCFCALLYVPAQFSCFLILLTPLQQSFNVLPLSIRTWISVLQIIVCEKPSYYQAKPHRPIPYFFLVPLFILTHELFLVIIIPQILKFGLLVPIPLILIVLSTWILHLCPLIHVFIHLISTYAWVVNIARLWIFEHFVGFF